MSTERTAYDNDKILILRIIFKQDFLLLVPSNWEHLACITSVVAGRRQLHLYAQIRDQGVELYEKYMDQCVDESKEALTQVRIALSAGAAEYTDYSSAEG